MSTLVPLVQASADSQSRFGDWAILAFLSAQALDGALTYLGVSSYGPQVEANPLIVGLIGSLGLGGGLVLAKGVAMLLGILLHLIAVHRVVAALTGVYVTTAIGPWTLLLFA